MKQTFKNRDTPLTRLQFDIPGIQALQQLWTAHKRGLGDIANELALPQSIDEVIEEINQEISSLL